MHVSDDVPEDAGVPEVLPPEDQGEQASAGQPSLARRAERAFGPIVAGLILDIVDFATFGPMGLYLGLIAGSLTGWYLARVLGIPRQWRPWLIAAAAVYCTIPFTEFIPAATLFGAIARFSKDKEEASDDEG